MIVIECLKSGFICSFNFTISENVRNELVKKLNLDVCDQGNSFCDVTVPPDLQNKPHINLRLIKKF